MNDNMKYHRIADMTANDIIEMLEKLNSELYAATGIEYLYFDLRTNYFSSIITFAGINLWNSEDDMREYNEDTDSYESLEDYLKRSFVEISDNLNAVADLWR